MKRICGTNRICSIDGGFGEWSDWECDFECDYGTIKHFNLINF